MPLVVINNFKMAKNSTDKFRGQAFMLQSERRPSQIHVKGKFTSIEASKILSSYTGSNSKEDTTIYIEQSLILFGCRIANVRRL